MVDLDSSIIFWLKDDDKWNYGDALTVLFLDVFTTKRVNSSTYHLIGSVISDSWLEYSLGSTPQSDQKVAFWCCGARQDQNISSIYKSNALFFGVRGPLSKQALRLPTNTTHGDPAIILPIICPVPKYNTEQSPICVTHYYESRDLEFVRSETNVAFVYSAKIDPSKEAVINLTKKIANASFVLASALHAAIVAYAYGIPFAFYDSGNIDCPFKWFDFAASVNIECKFVKNLEDGLSYYNSQKHNLKYISRTAILDACPFYIDPIFYEKTKKIEAHFI